MFTYSYNVPSELSIYRGYLSIRITLLYFLIRKSYPQMSTLAEFITSLVPTLRQIVSGGLLELGGLGWTSISCLNYCFPLPQFMRFYSVFK